MKKKNKKIKLITIFLSILLIIGLLILIIYNLTTNKTQKVEKMNLSFENRVTDLANYSYKDYLTVGWLQVQGTNIDYPILDSTASNDDPTAQNYGWRSPYYETGKNREVLLGHNILNVSSTPLRDMTILNNFEGLMAFTYDDFASDNLYISYTKGNDTELYKIYAIGFYDYNTDSSEGFSNSDEVKKYISKVRKNSIYDYDVDVNEKDTIITLKTCTRYFGSKEKQELYIDARKVRTNEDITKYQVKTNDNYKMLTKGISQENG